MLGDQTRLLLSRFLGSRVAIGDEIAFAVPGEDKVGAEILITRHAVSGHNRYFYQAPIGYATQPKPDKRNEHFVSAEVQGGALGISTIFLPCQALREYFYGLSHSENSPDRPTLYQILRISPNAHAAELRVAFRLRELELTAAGAPRSQRVALERAFNIVGQPELRACYDALRGNPEAAALFPYGGFGSLLVAGEPSRDRETFFSRRIVAFSPELLRRRFRVPLRKCDFYDDWALCRDVRRKLEFWLDPACLHTNWDRTWNQWKHLLETKIEVEGTFVESGIYRKRRGEWDLVTWETALPSRLEIKLPSDFPEQLEKAQRTYHRFGQYSRALDQIRLQLEHRAVERAELERVCSELRIPGDLMLPRSAGALIMTRSSIASSHAGRAGSICFATSTFSTPRGLLSSRRPGWAMRHTFSRNPGRWKAFLPCTPGSRRMTFGGTAIMRPSGWAFWGALFTGQIPEHGSRTSGNTLGKRPTLRWQSRSDQTESNR